MRKIKIAVSFLTLIVALSITSLAGTKKALYFLESRSLKAKMDEANALYVSNPTRAVTMYWDICNSVARDEMFSLNPDLYVGLRTLCLEKIRKLKNNDEKAFYQEIISKEAGQLLKTAEENNNLFLLRKIISDFPNTKEQAHSLFLLAQVYFDANESDTAKWLFKSALDSGNLKDKEKTEAENYLKILDSQEANVFALKNPVFFNWKQNIACSIFPQFVFKGLSLFVYDNENVKSYNLESGENENKFDIPKLFNKGLSNINNPNIMPQNIRIKRDGKITDLQNQQNILKSKFNRAGSRIESTVSNPIPVTQFEAFLINTRQADALIDVRTEFLWSLWLHELGDKSWEYGYFQRGEKLVVVEPYRKENKSNVIYSMKVTHTTLAYYFYLQAFDLSSNSLLWETWIGGQKRKPPHRLFVDIVIEDPFVEPIFLLDKNILYGVLSNGTFVAVDAFNGNILWSRILPFKENSAVSKENYAQYCPIYVSENILYCASPFSSEAVIAVDKNNGELLWSKEGNDTLLVGCNSDILYMIQNNILFAYNVKTKNNIWEYALPEKLNGIWTADSDCIYLPLNNLVYVIDSKTGTVQQVLFKKDGFCRLVINNDKLYIFSKESIQAFGAKKDPENSDREKE